MDELLIDLIRRTFAIFYGLLFIVGLSNVLVLIIVAVHRHMIRSVTNILILNLCLADLLFVSTMPLMIPFRLKQNWTFGLTVCKIYFICESLTRFVSVFFVGVLSMDRYIALCYTAWCKKYRNLTMAVVVSIVGWTLTAVLMTPMLIYSSVIEVGPNAHMCVIKWPRQESENQDEGSRNLTVVDTDASKFNVEHYFALYTFVFCFAVPAIVIIFFYCKIVLQMTAAGRRAVRLQHARRTSTYKKVTRMVLTIVAFYFLCWSPYWIMSFVSTFALVGSPNLSTRILFNVLHTLPYLNCSINPLLYTVMTQSFREALTTTLTRCKFCNAIWIWMKKNRLVCRRSDLVEGSIVQNNKNRLMAKESSINNLHLTTTEDRVRAPLMMKNERSDSHKGTLEINLTTEVMSPWRLKRHSQSSQNGHNGLEKIEFSTAI